MGTSSRPRVLVPALTLAGIALLAFVCGTEVIAQQERADEPVSSPVWWTLSDAVTPQELRARHIDVALHQHAYALAITESTYPVPQDRRAPAEKVVYFLDPRAEPEMVPFWLAFNILSLQVTYSPEVMQERLEGTALSDEGGRTVFDHLQRFAAHVSERRATTAQQVTDFVELMKETLATAAPEEKADLYRQWQQGQLETLEGTALARHINTDRLREIHRAWKNPPDVEATRLILPQLRSGLSEADWSELRRFLLDEVTPTIGTLMNTQPYD